MEAVQLEREDGIERRRLDVVAFAVVGFGRCDDGGAFVLLEPDFRQHIPVTGQCAADILRQRIPQQAPITACIPATTGSGLMVLK